MSEFGDLAREGDDDLLALLSGIIRLAEQLERSRDRSVAGVRLTPANGAIRIDAETRGQVDLSELGKPEIFKDEEESR